MLLNKTWLPSLQKSSRVTNKWWCSMCQNIARLWDEMGAKMHNLRALCQSFDQPCFERMSLSMPASSYHKISLWFGHGLKSLHRKDFRKAGRWETAPDDVTLVFKALLSVSHQSGTTCQQRCQSCVCKVMVPVRDVIQPKPLTLLQAEHKVAMTTPVKLSIFKHS